MITELPVMDLIFIDGGHSYGTVKSDWNCCKQLMHHDTVVVFDDYVNPDAVKHEGYGVNAVVDEIDRDCFEVRLLNPVDSFPKQWGVLRTRFAMVTFRT
jgi:predicted O-methyltransferase YrrM